MYNLIVSNLLLELDEEDPVEISRDRFLEYTSDHIGAQLLSLSSDAINAMLSWPALVMAEGKGDEAAQFCRLSDIRVSRSVVTARLQRLPVSRPLLNDDIWKLRNYLDIEPFEFSRHHWAIKEPDLIGILHGAELITDSFLREFQQLPLPSPSRHKVLEARRVISDWGHTEIDDLLLEAGIADLQADRTLGSRRDRANAIAQYALDHMDAATADNRLFSVLLVEKAGLSAPPGVQGDSDGGGASLEESPPPRLVPQEGGRSPNRVFVVHGRDDTARQEVVEYLRGLGLVPIVLHEQPNMGRHLLTKFIDEAELVTFAVVLMTADDFGGAVDGEPRPRARQNVILELGYFLAHLGQPRVCALISPGLETPSDFDGVVYIAMAEDGDWKNQLHRELSAANMPVLP
jgi:hypothetical protein